MDYRNLRKLTYCKTLALRQKGHSITDDPFGTPTLTFLAYVCWYRYIFVFIKMGRMPRLSVIICAGHHLKIVLGCGARIFRSTYRVVAL